MAQSYAKAPASPAKGVGAPPKAAPATSAAIVQKSGNQARAQHPSSPVKAPPSGGLTGWWNSTTDWVSEKAAGVADAASNAWDRTQAFASDLGDVVRTSSVGMKDGTLTASTDLDELLDLMPERVRKAIQLDKSHPSANRANLALDTKSGSLRVDVPDLQVKGVKAGGVSTGRVEAKGVSLTIDNAGQKAKEIVQGMAGGQVSEWVFGGSDKEGKAGSGVSRTQLKVASASAQDVKVAGPKGKPSSATSVKVEGVDITLEEVKGLPGGKSGVNTTASVARAQARGVQAGGARADVVRAQRLHGALSASGERGNLGVEVLGAQGLETDGKKIATAEARNLSTSFTNKGGGTPLADATPDTDLRTEGSAASLAVTGAAAGTDRVGSTRADGVAWTSAKGGTRAQAAAVDVDAIDTDAVDLASGKGTGVTVDVGADGLEVHARDASLTKLDTVNTDVAAASARNFALRRTATDMRLSADRAAVSGLDTTSVDATSANATHLALTTDAKGTRATADALNANGVVSGTNKVASMDLAGVSAARTNSGLQANVARGSVAGVDTAALDATTANATNLALTTDAKGMRATADALNASGVVSGANKVGSADLAGVSAAVDADRKGGKLELARGSVTDVQAAGGRLARADLAGVEVAGSQRDGGLRTDGKIATANVAGVDTATTDLKAGSLEGARWSVTPDAVNAEVARARVEGFSGPAGVGAEKGSLDNLRVQASAAKERGSVAVDQLHVEGGQGAGTRVGSLDANQLRGDFENKGGGLPGLDAKKDALTGGARISTVQARDIDGRQVDAQAFDAANFRAEFREGRKAASVDEGSATNVHVQHDGVDLRAAKGAITNGSTAFGDSLDARADSLRASGVVFDAHLGEKAPQGPSTSKAAAATSDAALSSAPKLDLLPLVRQVDNARVDAQLPLNAGKIGSVTAQEGTSAHVQARVNDGVVDTQGTRVTVDKPLDGPLWTTVNGAYLEEGKSPGTMKARADVGGFFDRDIGKDLPGEGPLPTRVDALVDRLTSGKPGSQTQAPTSVIPGRVEAGQATTGTSPVDVARIQAEGSAQLKAGKVDLGAASGQLVRQEADDNAVQFKADGKGALAMHFSRLLVGDMAVHAGDQTTTAGGLVAQGADITVQKGENGAQDVHATLPSIELRDVATQTKQKR